MQAFSTWRGSVSVRTTEKRPTLINPDHTEVVPPVDTPTRKHYLLDSVLESREG